MKHPTTLYLYELAWMLPSVALPVGMLAALLGTAFGAHIQLPSDTGRIDPAKVAETPPFDTPGVVETVPGRYEARIVTDLWFFAPAEIRVPEGTEVTFVGTSRDVIHGFFVPHADVNIMLLPGQVSRMLFTSMPLRHLYNNTHGCEEPTGIAIPPHPAPIQIKDVGHKPLHRLDPR